MKRIDLTGQRFGRLTVLNPLHLNKNKQLTWLCKCDCGNIVNVVGMSLRNGDCKSCGCLRKEMMRQKHTKHEAYSTRTKRERLYNIYAGMKQRCFNKRSEPYKYYGGRGVTICNEWLEDYTAFREWALSNGYSETLSIDRINNDGNYEPANCRWADAYTQVHNRRSCRLPDRDPATGKYMSDRRPINA